MVKIVVDSSVFIDYTRAGLGDFFQIVSLYKVKKVQVYVSASVILELWAGESLEDKGEEAKVNRLLLPFKKVDLTKQIAKKAGVLVRSKQINGGFDAIVAATALYLDAQLATSNKKHFEKVKGLKLFEIQET